MKRMYLQIADGKFFEYSSTSKKGFEAHKVEDEDTGKLISKGFRKYYDRVTGYIRKIEIIPPKGKIKFDQVQIVIEDLSGKGYFVITTGLETQNGGVVSNLQSIILALKSIHVGDEVRFTPYKITTDRDGKERDRALIGISVSLPDDEGNYTKLEDDEKYSISYYVKGKKEGTYDLVEGDIPALEWKEDRRGKSKPVYDEQTDALLSILDEFIEESKDFKMKASANSGGTDASFDDEDDYNSDEPEFEEEEEQEEDKPKTRIRGNRRTKSQEEEPEEEEEEVEEVVEDKPKTRTRTRTKKAEKEVEEEEVEDEKPSNVTRGTRSRAKTTTSKSTAKEPEIKESKFSKPAGKGFPFGNRK